MTDGHVSADGPRIAPGDRHALGLLGWSISEIAGLVGGTTSPNLFRTMGKHRRLFRGWLRFAGRLMPGGSLPRRDTELAILEVAHLRGCSYEFDHHVSLGRRAGVTDDDVARIVAGPGSSGWSRREQALLQAVDSLHHHGDIDDLDWSDLRSYLSETEAMELCLLVGHYEMLATFITTMRLQSDGPRRQHRARRN